MGYYKYQLTEDKKVEKIYIEDETDFANNVRREEALIASEQAAIARIEADCALMMQDLPDCPERTACIADCDAKIEKLNTSIAAREIEKAAQEAKLNA
jgi:hypothetical protein